MHVRGRVTGAQIVAGITSLGAVTLTAGGWLFQYSHPVRGLDIARMTLAVGLIFALIAGNYFPIHIRVSTKIYMGTVTLFLAAVLFPPALAATITAVGMLAGELSVRTRTSNPLHATLTQTGRWVVIVFCGSAISNISLFGTGLMTVTLLSVAAALFMLAADIATFPLVYCPATGIRPSRAALLALREGGVVEAAQYIVGLLGFFETGHGYWTLLLLCLPTALVYVAFKNSKEMHDETRNILENMADAVDLRDPYTGGHSRRVTEYTTGILRQLGKSGPEVPLIISAARVHDIGKIGIPDDILKKDGKLTEDEWAIMKLHPERGADLLARYPDFVHGVSIIRHHHERWDGAGYPHRLAANDIPFGARVIAVADSYDAMTSDRPYRQGMSPSRAARILRDGRGTQWDAKIVDAFLHSIADVLAEISPPHLELVTPDYEEESVSSA